MAKRLQLNFHRPIAVRVDEQGQPQPCVLGLQWVNRDTLQTLAKLSIPPTDAKGRPLKEKS